MLLETFPKFTSTGQSWRVTCLLCVFDCVCCLPFFSRFDDIRIIPCSESRGTFNANNLYLLLIFVPFSVLGVGGVIYYKHKNADTTVKGTADKRIK